MIFFLEILWSVLFIIEYKSIIKNGGNQIKA